MTGRPVAGRPTSGRPAIRAILFDLDGTLHDRTETVRRYLDGHVRRFSLPDGYAPRWVELDDLGYRPKSEVFSQLVQEFALTHDPAALLQDFSNHAWDNVAQMQYAREVLAELRRRGLKLGVITNGWTAKQLQALNGLGLSDLTDDVVVSEAVGMRKPDPAIFRLALSRLGVQASEAWYVGDSPINDVAGPQAASMRAALFPGGHPLPTYIRPDLVLRDLRGMLTLVPTSPVLD